MSAATPIDSKHLRALLAASTGGPWSVSSWHDCTVVPTRWLAASDRDGPSGESLAPWGAYTATGVDDAALVAEALSVLPGLLDEVDRLRSDSGDWMRMYLEAVQVFRTTCLDVAKRIEAGGSLADLVDLVGAYMDEGCDGALDDETVDLLLRAKAVATGVVAPDSEAAS